MPIMFNVEFCVPRGRWPFAGFGVGGVWGQLSFGNYYYSYYYYYYSDSAGHASDFVAAAQVFAGLRYEFDKWWNIGWKCRVSSPLTASIGMWTGGTARTSRSGWTGSVSIPSASR